MRVSIIITERPQGRRLSPDRPLGELALQGAAVHLQRPGGGRDIAFVFVEHALNVPHSRRSTERVRRREIGFGRLGVGKGGQDGFQFHRLARYCTAPSLMASTAVAMLA